MPIASKLCAFARIPARRAVFAAFSARRAPAQQTKKRNTRITPRQSADPARTAKREHGARETTKDLTRMIIRALLSAPAPSGKRRARDAGNAENEHNDKERPNGLSPPIR